MSSNKENLSKRIERLQIKNGDAISADTWDRAVAMTTEPFITHGDSSVYLRWSSKQGRVIDLEVKNDGRLEWEQDGGPEGFFCDEDPATKERNRIITLLKEQIEKADARVRGDIISHLPKDKLEEYAADLEVIINLINGDLNEKL